MADFNISIKKVLANEGGFADRRTTTGEVVNHGLTAATLRGLHLMPNPGNGPITDEEVAYVRSLTPEIVTPIYHEHYWMPNHLDDLKNQEVADKVFDLRVNSWKAAGEAFQHAINRAIWPDKEIAEDGIIGNETIKAANSADPDELLRILRMEMARSYREIAERDPRKAPNLESWLARLERA